MRHTLLHFHTSDDGNMRGLNENEFICVVCVGVLCKHCWWFGLATRYTTLHNNIHYVALEDIFPAFSFLPRSATQKFRTRNLHHFSVYACYSIKSAALIHSGTCVLLHGMHTHVCSEPLNIYGPEARAARILAPIYRCVSGCLLYSPLIRKTIPKTSA